MRCRCGEMQCGFWFLIFTRFGVVRFKIVRFGANRKKNPAKPAPHRTAPHLEENTFEKALNPFRTASTFMGDKLLGINMG